MTTTTRSNLAAISERDRLVYSQLGVRPTQAVQDRHELLELLRGARRAIKAVGNCHGCIDNDNDEARAFLDELAALDEGETR